MLELKLLEPADRRLANSYMRRENQRHGCGSLLCTIAVEVNSINLAFKLVEADVVEALETGAIDSAHLMIGHQEMLLPSHEEVLAPSGVFEQRAAALSDKLSVRTEGVEFLPMR